MTITKFGYDSSSSESRNNDGDVDGGVSAITTVQRLSSYPIWEARQLKVPIN